MTQRIIAQPLGLIDPDNLRHDETFLFSIFYEMFPEKKISVYKKSTYLVIHKIYWRKLRKIWDVTQEEFPLNSLPWIVDRFENGFFKTPAVGGLSDFDRSSSREFEGELIGINAMAHCCAENLPGFNIWNASRASYINKLPPQEWDIPRYILLEQGLLENLKYLATQYQAGTL